MVARCRELCLGDVADIVMGQSPPSETVSTEPYGLPLLNGPTEFGPYHPTPVQFTTNARKRARRGDILFCVRGSTAGRMNWADQEYAIGRGIAAIRHKSIPELQPFVKAVIQSHLPELLAQATGSTFPNISAEQLTRVPYPRLSEREQRAIAEILGALDDKIELNRRMNEALEAITAAIFKSWFVDFEPVRAKMERRWKAGESLPGLPADLYGLFPERLVESELGGIPEGWEIKPLSAAIDINPPRTLRKGRMAPYLDMSNMQTRAARALSVTWREFGSGIRFTNGDTLIARITPSLENGKACFVDFLSQGQMGWGSTECIVLRPKPPLPEEFAYFLARTERFRRYAISNMTGTSGRQRVPADSLGEFQVAIPSEPLSKRFGDLARDVMVQMKASDDESGTVAALRDFLTPKLISGRIRLRDAERLVEERCL